MRDSFQMVSTYKKHNILPRVWCDFHVVVCIYKRINRPANLVFSNKTDSKYLPIKRYLKNELYFSYSW